MVIGGLQKTTLIDFPGKVACTVFTVGCNFRCPFCHNRDLATLDLFKKSGIKPVSEKEFFEFLEKRKRLLDGVCITGGEPCINQDLPEFIKKIKKFGFLVKLDTNGSNPGMLEKLIKEKLIDFVAMDIKTTFAEYTKVVHLKSPSSASGGSTRLIQSCSAPDATAGKQNSKLIQNVKKSIQIILNSGLPYEFRTTVVPTIHNKEVLIKMAKEIRQLSCQLQVSSRQLTWYWQNFRPQNCLDPEFLKIKPFSSQELKAMLAEVQKILPGVKIRGEEN